MDKDVFLVFVSFNTEDDFEMINACNVAKDSLDVVSRKKVKLSEVNFYVNQKIPLENVTIDI